MVFSSNFSGLKMSAESCLLIFPFFSVLNKHLSGFLAFQQLICSTDNFLLSRPLKNKAIWWYAKISSAENFILTSSTESYMLNGQQKVIC
jgi:hypothetical protein